MKITKEIKNYVSTQVRSKLVAMFDEKQQAYAQYTNDIQPSFNRLAGEYKSEIKAKAQNLLIDGYEACVTINIVSLRTNGYLTHPEYDNNQPITKISAEILLKISLNKNDLTIDDIDELIDSAVEEYYK